MNPKKIGTVLAQLRKLRKLTGAELARRSGLSQSQISRLENGQQGFRGHTLARLSKALSVPPAYFFPDTRDESEKISGADKKKLTSLGRELQRDPDYDIGKIAATPTYKAFLRRLGKMLGEPETDSRTLRRTLDAVLLLSNLERAKLLRELTPLHEDKKSKKKKRVSGAGGADKK